MAGPEDVQAAFRAGLEGRSLRAAQSTGLAETAADWAAGPNQSLIADLHRLPGLSEPRAAYTAGRAVRRILQLFDQAGAPAAIGRQFLDNLHAAVTAQAMRDRRAVWGGSDTVAMFMEMFGRFHDEDGQDFAQVESSLLEYALTDPDEGQGRVNSLLAALRRRRRG